MNIPGHHGQPRRRCGEMVGHDRQQRIDPPRESSRAGRCGRRGVLPTIFPHRAGQRRTRTVASWAGANGSCEPSTPFSGTPAPHFGTGSFSTTRHSIANPPRDVDLRLEAEFVEATETWSNRAQRWLGRRGLSDGRRGTSVWKPRHLSAIAARTPLWLRRQKWVPKRGLAGVGSSSGDDLL